MKGRRIFERILSNKGSIIALIGILLTVSGFSGAVTYHEYKTVQNDNNTINYDTQQITIFHNTSKYKLMEQVANDTKKISELEMELNSSKSMDQNLTSEIKNLENQVNNLNGIINMNSKTGDFTNQPDLQLSNGQSFSQSIKVSYSGLFIVSIKASCSFKIYLQSGSLNIVPVTVAGKSGNNYYFELPVIGTVNNPNSYILKFTNTDINIYVYNPPQNIDVHIYEKY